ncbi:PVC-type heme-binding CxxCH protein [Haloferula sp. A504]|uniref:PVC-type heme-binding CxxCH protein n=1 Tax=Haloferula sp. A504 TaxID=3373601 RepID=UPI0031C21580|nr:GDSL-type esterase/lipase family protein [Verrucomicrobiaceae bacterium E54]
MYRTLFALPRLLLGAALLPLPSLAQLPLQKNDVVCLIGNGLADRMQHDGWVETLLQSGLADQQIAFRNMAFTGDTVTSRPRSKGFTSPEDYLKHCQADVIFVMFGYNESFKGEAGVAGFRNDLGSMIDKYRAAKFNGESEPRFVLFSPIAHEDHGDPNLPDGGSNNVNLALYTGAIKQVAGEKGVAFVDLFSASQSLYAKADSPITLNGVHLLPEGNRQLGEVIASAITGKQVKSTPAIEPLRQAVLDKNWHWHNRYRATDGNDIWGGRSGLKFVNGQTNREVLEHELKMLDVMTANRDRKIWATAQGRDHQVDDSNVPAPIEVISNVGGGSKSSNPGKEGNEDYLSGEEAIAKMHIPKGFEVNLFADEKRFPQMVNPVQMQVDSKGRLWAACWSTYPKWEPLKEMTDSLLILPDEDRDGVADKAIEFAKVHNPLGFEFWAGGVIVASQPDILFLKDTDGDDKADLRIVLVQGIGSSDTHHAANNFIIGPDGALYWQSGIFLQNNFETPWGPNLSSTASGMYRFDPRRYTITFHAGNSPNPHGTSFDSWGYHFANDGTGGRSYQVRPQGNGFKMHELVKKEVRPVPANAVVSSSNFPDDLQQDFLVCNVIGYLGIKRYELHRDGETGVVKGDPTDSFFFSDDKNFRPTDAEFGSDGALYIADWQNIIIGHMQHNIRDPKRDKKHGRIYRMVCKDRPLQEPVAIDDQPIAKLLENLKHPVDGVRHRTRIELSEHESGEVMAAVKEWMKQFDPKNKEHAHHLLEALWLHQQHDVRDQELLDALLNSPEPHARPAAKTVAQHWGPADPTKGKRPTQIVQEEEKIDVKVPAHLTGQDADTYRLGAEIFHRDAHCVTCHQPDGKGMAKVYPPLADSAWVTGSEERLIKLTLHGLWGKIEVNGEVYDPAKGVPPMTAFGALLDDKETAAVLTYVRNSWGNKASPVAPETVKKVRAETRDRSIFWKPEELLKEHPMK